MKIVKRSQIDWESYLRADCPACKQETWMDKSEYDYGIIECKRCKEKIKIVD